MKGNPVRFLYKILGRSTGTNNYRDNLSFDDLHIQSGTPVLRIDELIPTKIIDYITLEVNV